MEKLADLTDTSEIILLPKKFRTNIYLQAMCFHLKIYFMRFIYFAIIILFASCSQPKPIEYGSIKGNVFYKYNNFVGNRPDAGSKVYVYSINDSISKYSSTTDVRGDYAFDSVPVGLYMVVVRSETTKSSARDYFDELNYNRKFIDSIFRTNISSSLSEYNETISEFEEKASKGLREYEGMKAVNIYDKYTDSVEHYANRYLTTLPSIIKHELLILGRGGSKVDIQNISVKKGRAETIVTDFGITYF